MICNKKLSNTNRSGSSVTVTVVVYGLWWSMEQELGDEVLCLLVSVRCSPQLWSQAVGSNPKNKTASMGGRKLVLPTIHGSL